MRNDTEKVTWTTGSKFDHATTSKHRVGPNSWTKSICITVSILEHFKASFGTWRKAFASGFAAQYAKRENRSTRSKRYGTETARSIGRLGVMDFGPILHFVKDFLQDINQTEIKYKRLLSVTQHEGTEKISHSVVKTKNEQAAADPVNRAGKSQNKTFTSPVE